MQAWSSHVSRQEPTVDRDWLIAAGLVLIGIASRELLVDWPNFKPVNAVCVIGGLMLSRWWLAALVPVAIAAVSDWRLGGLPVELTVAVMLAYWLNLASFRWMARRLHKRGAGAWTRAAIATGVLAGAIQFYLTTNFAFWLGSGLYAREWSGLASCYLAGIPFFWRTLAGDLLFLGAPLLAWQLVEARQLAARSDPGEVVTVSEQARFRNENPSSWGDGCFAPATAGSGQVRRA
jgi:hypothetical protein